MTPEEAIKFLKQVLVTKQGLTLEQCAAVVVAWNVVATAVTKSPAAVDGAGG